MKKNVLLALSFITTLALANPILAADTDYVANADAIVKAADWNKAETITVEVEEHSYTPKDITFKANQPYKLVIKNLGEQKHYYTAPEFFKAVALRKVQSDKDGEVKAPYLKAIEVYNGGQLSLFIVPTTPGTYDVHCTIEDHEQKGMKGTLTIQ